MSSEQTSLTPRAKLFQALAYDLRVLRGRSIQSEAQRRAWDEEVQQLREKLHTTYRSIAGELPGELDHYFDDVDIRSKDDGYRVWQERGVDEIFHFIFGEIQKGVSEEGG